VDGNLIADLLQAAVLKADLELKIIECNEICAKMFCYSSIDSKANLNLYQLMDQSQWSRLKASANGIISGQLLGPETYIGRKKDGSCFACEMHLQEIADRGMRSGFYVLINDITAKLNSQEASMIKWSHKWFRFLFKSMPGGQLILDQRSNIDDMNDYALSLLGYQKIELVGKSFSEICPDCAMSAADLAVSGKWDNLEQLFRPRSGQKISVICSIREFTIAGNEYFLMSFHDLSAVRELQNKLVASEEKYRILVEAAQEGIAIVDTEENIVFCNDAFAQIFGYKKEFLIGSSLDLLAGDKEFQKYRKYTSDRRQGQHDRYETIMKGRDGTLHNILVSAAPLYATDGSFKGTMGVVLDLSDLKKKEKILRKQKANLKWLSSRLIELQENDRKFLARELHDCICQKLGLAKVRLGKMILESEVSSRPLLGEISNIISDIAADVRVISSTLRPRILDDLGLVPTIEWYLEEHGGKSGLACRLTQDGTAYSLEPSREVNIFRIIQECILNIHKHAEANQVEVNLDYHPDKVILKIVDNGKGFSVDHLSEPETPRSNFGLLNISERVDMMSGHLDIISRKGEGTSVIIEIPRE